MSGNDNFNMKYFLRGLGVGIVVCTLIFSMQPGSTKTKTKTMTKSQIIAKAKEYGMVEEMDSKLDAIKDKASSTEEPEVSATIEPTTEPTVTPSATNEPTIAPTDIKATDSDEKYPKIEVKKGQDTYTVSMNLQRLGIVKDGKVFYNYIKKNKLSGKMVPGSYRIQKESTYSSVASIIFKK